MLGSPVIDEYPLTPVQQGMLFHRLEGRNIGVDIEQFVGDLGEQIDVEAMRAAWQRVADRHPVMRTRFRWADRDEPVQEVVEHVDVPLAVHDLRHLTATEQDERLAAFLVEDRRAGFELDVAPLWRLTLFHLGPGRERFVFTYHHSLLDTSVVWMAEEAFRTYDAARRGEVAELVERRPYKDHIEWLHTHLAQDREAAQAYYAALLDGFDSPTRLLSLEGIDADDDVYGALRFALPADVSERFHAFTTTTTTTTTTTDARHLGGPVLVEAAWALVLAAFSGTTDVVFGSTRGCRRSGLPGSDSIMGLFINTPPVRATIDPAQSVLALLQSVRAQQVDKRAHEHAALSDIQAIAETRPSPLFDTIVVVNERHQGSRLKDLGGPFAARDFDLHDQTNFPLTLLAYLDPQAHFKLSYDRRRFTAASMERVRQLLVEVLTAIVDHAEAPVGELPRMPAVESDRLALWNSATAREYPSGACVHELFEAQVDRAPDAVALVHREQRLTYRELDERANAVAAHLRQLGAGPDAMVGIYIERSAEMVVGLLGILKAGAAYVPMDPAYPSVRIGMMLEDSHAEIVLTHSRLADSITGVRDVVALDTFDGRHAARVAVPDLRSDHLAYVIFTSGSTGRPKGVMIEHRNVANFFTAMDEQLDFTPGVTAPGTWLAVTSISFDISVLELFWTLTRGFTVVVQDDEGRLSTETSVPARTAPAKDIDFSLFYFAADAGGPQRDRYRLLLEGAKFADAHGFAAVWTPERHFHEFGGLYPNPALTSAAVAVVTEHVEIRAGSVVLPLHNPIRVAEDWSVVDNLSNGRVGLSFASGWHANDFALAPDNFERRRELMAEGIDTVRALWRGESVPVRSGDGREIEVRMFPPPVQHAPKLWITAGGSLATFTLAGTVGASILTNLLVMGQDDLVANVAAYREAYRAAGHPGDGHVTVMLHTFVGRDAGEVRALVREPFLDYLKSSTDLINKVQWEATSFAKPGETGGGASVPDLDDLDPDEIAVIMDHAFERYVGVAGLFGTPESCLAQVDRLRDLGVDEIACLIDFGVDQDVVLANLEHLDELRRAANAGVGAVEAALEPASDERVDDIDLGLVAQVERHRVTHVQCTPSMAAVIAADRSGLTALASLQQLLLGGEALPPPLVDEIRPALRGRLLNMYGPTETTIWSTVSPIERAGEPITIGRPIANTHVYVVDRNLQPNPIGAAGELLIGGDGVVRGYLDRPELTAERFVELAAAGGERVYRTGDLVTMLPDGELQFSGRLDHQVKIRGYRIELGEIEAVIGRFANVRENVVVARTDTPGDPRLVAYVVPGAHGEAAGAGAAGADVWGQVWDETYGAGGSDDPTFDTAGWNDSYTGDPIPLEQMHEWVDGTVARIRELAPRRVLEIGCGTGLLLFRLAPHCERYVGVDLAQHGLDRIAAALPGAGLTNVQLRRGGAHEVSSLVDGSFDTVVLNSVSQYFPDAGYLVDVLTSALVLLEPGGSLFVGDVRSRDHQPLFAAAIELARASAAMAASELASRVDHREAADEELVVDPALFHTFAARHPDVADVDVRIKPGRAGNEMTRFRYDVVIHKAGGAPAPVAEVQELSLDRLSMFAVREALAAEPAVLRVTGLRNDRLVREAALVRLLAGEPTGTVADVRTALAAVPGGDHPDDLHDVDDRYDVAATWSAAGVDRFDIVLRAKTARVRIPAPAVDTSVPWSTYTNQPARGDAKTLAPELRAHLRSSLPDHMVPTAFVVLDALPRTPNGKIDRNALPAPDRSRVEDAEALVAPAGDVEVTIATIWQDILSLDAIGVETNLFDLGANSLMMVRASSRLGEALGRKVSLVEMFGYPTVRSLAAHLGGGDGDGDGAALSQSQDRAEARREAMRRRQGARAGRRR